MHYCSFYYHPVIVFSYNQFLFLYIFQNRFMMLYLHSFRGEVIKLIKLEHVSKEFETRGKKKIDAVNDVSLEINTGEIFGIIGFSGAGKSTLVRCINLLEHPTQGKVFLNDTELTSASAKELRQERRKIGMIFQQFNLLAQKTCIDNITFPLIISGVSKKEAREKAKKLLKLVDLEDKARAFPEQLSGGQKQRIAIARALATSPEVLLCDEATSALDPITTRSILALLKRINEELKVTIVVITHEMRVVEQICDRVAVMSEGVIKEVGAVKDIFLNPKSETARKLILPERDRLPNGKRADILRLAFDGQSSSEPIISELTLESGAYVNILGANTEDIGGKAYGQMLIELPADETAVKKIKAFLDKRQIHYEEGGNADVTAD